MAKRAEHARSEASRSRPSAISGAPPLWLERVAEDIRGLGRPGSVALVSGESAARTDGLAVLDDLGRALGTAPASVTEVGLSGSPARTSEELLERLDGHPLLCDVEALCWDPWLSLDVRRFLELHARRSGVVALWPGRVKGRVATFSAPGRKDHQRVELAGSSMWSILRPVPTRFPDEVPFEIERIAR